MSGPSVAYAANVVNFGICMLSLGPFGKTPSIRVRAAIQVEFGKQHRKGDRKVGEQTSGHSASPKRDHHGWSNIAISSNSAMSSMFLAHFCVHS